MGPTQGGSPWPLNYNTEPTTCLVTHLSYHRNIDLFLNHAFVHYSTLIGPLVSQYVIDMLDLGIEFDQTDAVTRATEGLLQLHKGALVYLSAGGVHLTSGTIDLGYFHLRKLDTPSLHILDDEFLAGRLPQTLYDMWFDVSNPDFCVDTSLTSSRFWVSTWTGIPKAATGPKIELSSYTNPNPRYTLPIANTKYYKLKIAALRPSHM